jgi:hypothetical protein
VNYASSNQLKPPLDWTDRCEPTGTITGCVAIDANPYVIRVTHTTPTGIIVAKLEVRPTQWLRILDSVRSQRQVDPQLVLTGARGDSWPPGLLPALALEFGPVSWASDLLLGKTRGEVRRCTQLLKFFRSTFLAQCAGEGLNPEPRVDIVLTNWKRAVIEEVMWEFDFSPSPDIPF